MKVYLLFTPAFLEWPLEITREFARRFQGAEAGGLATGHRQVAERVTAARDVRISPFAYLDDLERGWLATPVRPGEMAHYEALFGTETLRRLVIADRQIGRGYVVGGLLPETELMRLTREPENIERYVAGILRYLLQVLENFRPDIVFCYTVAGAQAFALSIVCQHLGIPFARFNHTRIGKNIVVDDSPLYSLGPVRERFEAALDSRAPLDHRLPEARRLLADLRSESHSPDYLAGHKSRAARQRSLGALARAAAAAARNSLRLQLGRMELPLRKPKPSQHFLHLARTAIRARRLQRQRLFAEPGARPSAPFAYFPLHVDPEATTMVLSPMHTDQLAVIEALSKSLPLGMRLVVKEHLPMLGLRPPTFYERLARIPGVFLVSPDDSGIALVREAAMTATISGTAGWEAVALGKPALLIGTPPYTMIGEGFVQCGDLSALPTAVEQTLTIAPASEDRLALYIAAVLDVSFRSGNEVIWGRVTEETVRAHPEFLDAVVSRLVAIAEARRRPDRSHVPQQEEDDSGNDRTARPAGFISA